MKLNLLTNMILGSLLVTTISACDTREDLQTYPDDLKPVQVEGALNYQLEFNEDDEPFVWSMVADVVNPEDTTIYPREFTYYRVRLNSNGSPWTDPETGEQEQLFVGPPLPQGSVIKSNEIVALGPQLWTESLVHPYTAEQRQQEIDAAEAENLLIMEWNENNPEEPQKPLVPVPAELYSQGRYQFSYLLDNGSETIVERNFQVIVNGVEDKVEEVIMSTASIEAPVGYAIPLSATIVPSNATFKDITWASSNTDYVTVDQNGSIMALEAGIDRTVDVTATSADGLVVGTTIVNVIEFPTQPVAVDVTLNGKVVSKSVVELGIKDSMDLDGLLIPDGLFEEDDYPLTWTSSNPDAVSINEDGIITGLVHGEQATITASIPSIELSQTVNITVGDSTNLLLNANANPDFETGELSPWISFWANPQGTGNLAVTNTAGVPDSWDGWGLHVTSDGSKQTGVTLPESFTPQALGANDGSTWKISFDVKSNNGNRGGWVRFLYNPNGWAQRIDSWYQATTEWQRIEIIKEAKDWSAGLARMDLYIDENAEGIDVQFDNIRVEFVE